MDSKIEKLKKEYGYSSSEQLFQISNKVDYQCGVINSIVNTVEEIYGLTQFSMRDDTDDPDFLMDRITSIDYESRDLPDEIEKLRVAVECLREWGQDWKDFTKELVEENNINLEEYL